MVRIRRRSLLAVLAFLILPHSAIAQNVSLSGRVTDPQGGVVVGASVTVSGAAGGRPAVEHTGTDGTFTFAAVASGRYTIQIDSPGFTMWMQDVNLAPGTAPITAVLQIAGLLEDVQVSGTAPYNLTKPIPTASRLGLSPLETPASVAVISGDVIRSLGTQTLIEAKAYAPGITTQAPMGSGGNIINARGFTGTNSVKQLYNGMEIYNGGGVVTFPFDPWGVDHIGILSGPASVLYGTGAIGGAINVVPKRPDPAQRHNEFQFGAGRFGTYHEAVDTTGPIGHGVSYRLDASVYNSDHWVPHGQSNSQMVSGSVRVDAPHNLRFTISNDFGNQNPSSYLGTPVVNNAPVPGLRFINYNVLDAKINFTDNWTNVETLWTPSSSLSFHNNTFFLYHDRIYHDTFTYTFVPATNQVRRTNFRDINNTYETQYGDTGYLKKTGTVMGRSNEILIGLDFNRNYYHRYDNVRGGSSLVDALNPVDGNWLDFYNNAAIPFYLIHVDQVAAFAEDHLHLTNQLSLVVGARHDHYHVNREDLQTFATTISSYDPNAWNAGAVFEPIKDLSFYAQYAKASDPVNSLSSIAANQQGFHLSPGRQIEAGVKQSVMNGVAEWTVAVYDLVKKDLLTPSIDNPTLTDQVGQQSSRGVEGSFALTMGPFRAIANGTILRARFDDFRAVAGSTTVQLAGNTPLNVPERSANLMLFWNPVRAVEARGTMRVVGRRFADNTNVAASVMPSYKVVDFGVRWKVQRRLGVDVRLDNAFDEIYGDSGSTTMWLLGPPRTATVSVNVPF